MKSITLQEAVLDDAECLSRIAIRSKAYWGYSAEFMDACIEELRTKYEKDNPWNSRNIGTFNNIILTQISPH